MLNGITVDRQALKEALLDNPEYRDILERLSDLQRWSCQTTHHSIDDAFVSGGFILQHILPFESSDLDVFLKLDKWNSKTPDERRVISNIHATKFFGLGSYVDLTTDAKLYDPRFCVMQGNLGGKDIQLIFGHNEKPTKFDIPACEIFCDFTGQVYGHGLNHFYVDFQNAPFSYEQKHSDRIIKYAERGVPVPTWLPDKLVVLEKTFDTQSFTFPIPPPTAKRRIKPQMLAMLMRSSNFDLSPDPQDIVKARLKYKTIIDKMNWIDIPSRPFERTREIV